MRWHRRGRPVQLRVGVSVHRLVRLRTFRADPYALRGGGAKRDLAFLGCKSQRLVIVAIDDADTLPRLDAAPVEKFEQTRVALVDAADDVALARVGLRQQHQPAPPTTRRTFGRHKISVRT